MKLLESYNRGCQNLGSRWQKETRGGRASKGKRHQMPEPKNSCIVSKLPNFDVKFQKYLKTNRTNRGDEIGPKNDVWYKASVEILILS